MYTKRNQGCITVEYLSTQMVVSLVVESGFIVFDIALCAVLVSVASRIGMCVRPYPSHNGITIIIIIISHYHHHSHYRRHQQQQQHPHDNRRADRPDCRIKVISHALFFQVFVTTLPGSRLSRHKLHCNPQLHPSSSAKHNGSPRLVNPSPKCHDRSSYCHAIELIFRLLW